MKQLFKLTGLSLCLAIAFGLASCTNELNGISANSGDKGLALAKAPDITAWSGSHYLTPANGTTDTRAYENFVAIAQAQAQALAEIQTRAESTNSYDYNFPSEMSKLENISIPTDDAQELKDDWNTSYDLNKPILIPEGETRNFQVPNHFVGDIYVAGTYSPQTLGNNDGNTIYVLAGGVLNVEGVSTGGNTIYNAGKVNMKNFDGSKIKNIYNIGELYIGNQYGAPSLPADVGIYNKGGYLEFNTNGKEWSVTDIMGTIISDNIVQSNGKIKFQNENGYRDICHLIATDLVEITDGTNIFGQITAPNLKFDGAKIKLHPEGLIKADVINMPNSATFVYADSDSKGLIKVRDIYFQNTNNFIGSFSENIYFNIIGEIDFSNSTKFGGQGKHYSNINDYIKENQSESSRFNSEITVNPSCGGEGEGPEIKFPDDLDPDFQVCPECGHSDHGTPGEDPCDNCGDDEGCNKKQPEVPEVKFPDVLDPGFGVTLCPLCDHPVLNLDGLWYHVKDYTQPGEPCHQCEGTHSPCTTEKLRNAMAGKNSSEVEVNLSINDKDNQMDIKHLVTKLSIHVRYPEDVKIIIPIPGAYQVDQDDLAIFNEHYGKESVYGGNTNSVTYELGDNSVTLTIQHDFDGNKIVVTTHGINPEVFNYCRENYGDGLNFEIYSYFNYLIKEGDKFVSVDNSKYDEVFTEVKEELNKSTIEFIYYNEDMITHRGDCPNYYINAFNDTQDNVAGEKDCTVRIVEGQEDYFSEGKAECHHLNGSQYNVIYKNKLYEKCPDGEHDHDFLWKYEPIESSPTEDGDQSGEG